MKDFGGHGASMVNVRGVHKYLGCHLCGERLYEYQSRARQGNEIIYEFTELEVYVDRTGPIFYKNVHFSTRRSVHAHELCMERDIGFLINEEKRSLVCFCCGEVNMGKLTEGKRFIGIGKERVVDHERELVELCLFRYMCMECFTENAGPNFWQEKKIHIG